MCLYIFVYICVCTSVNHEYVSPTQMQAVSLMPVCATALHICTYICMYMYTTVYTYKYKSWFLSTYRRHAWSIFVQWRLCIYLYVYMCICMYSYTISIYIHMYTYTFIHARVHSERASMLCRPLSMQKAWHDGIHVLWLIHKCHDAFMCAMPHVYMTWPVSQEVGSFKNIGLCCKRAP